MTRVCPWLAALLLAPAAHADGSGWEVLTGDRPLEAWRKPSDKWIVAGDAALSPENPRRLVARPGAGVLVNGVKGEANNLVSKKTYADLEVRFDFLISRGSNSGVKFMGLYEIQIADSYGRKALTGSDCGGVYPRAELRPRYKTTDAGVPPRVNACRKAGEWQTLEAVFLAPRFEGGKKVGNARLVKAVLNGQVIHEDVELPWPTGAVWNTAKEVPAGPLYLQADHGPVAFRDVLVRAPK